MLRRFLKVYHHIDQKINKNIQTMVLTTVFIQLVEKTNYAFSVRMDQNN